MEIIIDDDLSEPVPSLESIQQAITSACEQSHLSSNTPELCIRFASNGVVQQLNQQWRHKDQVTDVLSFPMQEGPNYDDQESFGDIILAVPFVHQEAKRLGLTSESHILHLIIHGMLHLIAYDHMHDQDAHIMQAIETKAMLTLGLHQPYEK